MDNVDPVFLRFIGNEPNPNNLVSRIVHLYDKEPRFTAILFIGWNGGTIDAGNLAALAVTKVFFQGCIGKSGAGNVLHCVL